MSISARTLPPFPSPSQHFQSTTPPGIFAGSSYARVATRQHVDNKVLVNQIPTPTRHVPSHKSGPDVPGRTGRTTHTPSGKCSSNPGRTLRRKSKTTSFHPHQWPTPAPSPTSALPSPPPISPSASEQSGNRNVPCLRPAFSYRVEGAGVGTAVGSPPPTSLPSTTVHMHDRFGAGFAGSDDPTSPRGELAAFPAFPVASVSVTVRRRGATTGREPRRPLHPSVHHRLACPYSPCPCACATGPDTTPGYTDPGRDWPITYPPPPAGGATRWIVYIGSGQASSCPTYPFIYEAS
jgi:hypothetical protein